MRKNQDMMANEAGARIATLENENAELKRSVSAFKRENAKLRKRVEHYKALDLEGDELNDEKARRLDEKERVIKGLSDEVLQARSLNAELRQKVESLTLRCNELQAKLSVYREAPWYRRIFMRL